MFPKPRKGSGTAARRNRKKKLDEYRRLVNRFCLEADGYVCQISGCGKPACHAHHVERRGRTIESWRESPNFRLSLCQDCHSGHEHRAEPDKEEMLTMLEVARKKRMLDFNKWLKSEKKRRQAL